MCELLPRCSTLGTLGGAPHVGMLFVPVVVEHPVRGLDSFAAEAFVFGGDAVGEPTGLEYRLS